MSALDMEILEQEVGVPEAGAKTQSDDLKADWLAHFDKATSSASGLAQIAVPLREPIVGGWFKQGDLGFIYGARGLGKTWLAMFLARKCVEGGSVADWKVHKPRRVLYVDGEMPLDGICERDVALSAASVDGMFYLQHEALFHLTGQGFEPDKSQCPSRVAGKVQTG